MMHVVRLLLWLGTATLIASEKVVRYDNYRVLEVGPLKDANEANLILGLVDNDQRLREVIMLNDNIAKTAPVELAVSPDSYDRVQEILDENGIHFLVVNNNLQESFDETLQENDARLQKLKSNNDPTLFDHTAYLRYLDQVSWVQNAAAMSPIATVFNLGTSYEGRTIIGLSINAATNLPVIWIDANIHAREWITSATTLYIIDEILTGTSADAQYLRSNFRFYIIPNLNPDGYEHTWTNDRMWRKTRSPNAGSICMGTDPNRNWGAFWGGEGASDLPCSDTYRGPAAFSEVENVAARNFLQFLRPICNLYISIHSYSQFWLLPYGGTRDKPDDYDELMRVGNLVAAAIKNTNGLDFLVGTVPDLLYVASGGSFDWTKLDNGMDYGYSPELRPATAGQGGFDIPPVNIIPSGQEMFAGLVVAAREAKHKL